MQDDDKWHRRFMAMADLVASWSKDPSTKVGCVLVDERRNVLSVGYNGFPRSVIDDSRLDDRPTKYMMVQHAEVNAVITAGRSLEGATAYVTHSPCASCTGALIQAGVKHILSRPMRGALLDRFLDSLAIAQTMRVEADVAFTLLCETADDA